MPTPVEGKLMSDIPQARPTWSCATSGSPSSSRPSSPNCRPPGGGIVAAADDQRRRIESDIHDGAQQQLLAIAAKLALAESVAGRDEGRERALVAQLKAGTSGALETLRELARGIYPPLLADQGLTAAVTTQAGKAPVPVEVDAAGIGRYPAEIETAIYFCCMEALHNAARHAPGSAVRISLAEDRGQVMFTVTDDGPGFDPAAEAAGSGLRNMSDRLAALGGSCQVETRTSRGTAVAGRVGFGGAMARGGDAVPLAGRMEQKIGHNR
jgi:signal transduction histidine kinase